MCGDWARQRIGEMASGRKSREKSSKKISPDFGLLKADTKFVMYFVNLIIIHLAPQQSLVRQKRKRVVTVADVDLSLDQHSL